MSRNPGADIFVVLLLVHGLLTAVSFGKWIWDSIVQCSFVINLSPGLQVSISTDGQSTAGEEYTLVCSVSALADGESVDDLTVEWLAPSGSVVESGSGITQLTHTLNPLLPSHGGEYRCRATLQGGAGQELLGEDTVNVIVSGSLYQNSFAFTTTTCPITIFMHSDMYIVHTQQ